MGDALFDIEDNELDDNNNDTGTEDNNPGVAYQAHLEALKEQNKELVQSNRELAAQLKEIQGSLRAQPAPKIDDETPMDDADTIIKQFASDPAGVMSAAADGRIDKAIVERLSPLLNPLVSATHNNLVNLERSRIDTQFGVGTFDEILLPEVQKDFDRLAEANNSALASQDTIRALVQRIEAQHRTDLNEREAKLVEQSKELEEKQVAKVVNALPPSMRPRSKDQDQALNDEGKLYISEVAKATGEKIDEKYFAKLMNTGNTLEDYLAATTESK